MVAFIMKATVYAHILEDEEVPTQNGSQTGLQKTTQKNYPENNRNAKEDNRYPY